MKKPGTKEQKALIDFKAIAFVRRELAETQEPYTSENCKAIIEKLPGLMKRDARLAGDDVVASAIEHASKFCLDNARLPENQSKKGMKDVWYRGEYKEGEPADAVYVGDSPFLCIPMSAALPEVLLCHPRVSIRDDGERHVHLDMSEFGSENEAMLLSPGNYKRDWARKIGAIIDKNKHLFMDDPYWETEIDREVVRQMAGGGDFFTVSVDEGKIAKQREFIESLPEDTIFTVLDNRVVIDDSEKRTLSRVVQDAVRRKTLDYTGIMGSAPAGKISNLPEEESKLVDEITRDVMNLRAVSFRTDLDVDFSGFEREMDRFDELTFELPADMIEE